MTPIRSLRRAALPLLLAVLLGSAPARADALQDVGRLLKQGQHGQALEQVDKYLAGKPKDAQGRFLKGIILTEMNRQPEAVTIFTKLTEDYPELPEPYNNLAVIYAQQKQYEKAKQALEMAIRTHPSYATAHENLGDIYARLASQAYDKALQLDSANASAQNKLAMIRDLMSASGRTAKPAAAKPVATVADARPAEPSRPEAAKPAVPPAPTPAAPPKPAEPPKAAEAPKPAVEPAKPAPAAKPEPPKPEAAKPADANAEITRALDGWTAAWSKKDVKGYLAFYAKDFKTPGGETRAAWEAERTKRISKPGPIQVSYEGAKISVQGDEATVRFRQHYKSSSLKTSSGKTVVLVRRDGKWLIQQERVGG